MELQAEILNIKICIVGPRNAGKSTLIHKYIFNDFVKLPQTNLNDFSKKQVRLSNQKEASLQIWDIAGEERFAKLTNLYTNNAKGFLVVGSAENDNVYRDVLQWKNILYQNQGLKAGDKSLVPMVLVMSKCDLIQQSNCKSFLNDKQFQQFGATNGFCRSIKISSMSGKNVHQCFSILLEQIIKSNQVQMSPTKTVRPIKLNNPKSVIKKKKSCF